MGRLMVCRVVCRRSALFDFQTEVFTEFDILSRVEVQRLPRAVGADGKLVAAALDQYGQYDPVRSAVVKNLVHGRSYRTPAVHDIVDQNDGLTIDRKRDV